MPTRSLITIAVAWVVIGVVIALLMRRRGHAFSVWMTLGVVLGPLAVPLAVERIRFHESAAAESRERPTPRRLGFDVLAGIDGSEESLQAAEAALDLFGWEMTELTLVTVLPHGSEHAHSGQEEGDEATAMLNRVAASLGFEPVKTKILFGRPGTEMAEYARTSGIELIVTGPRGRGTTEALFGSVTAHLVGHSEVPVFVGPSSRVNKS